MLDIEKLSTRREVLCKKFALKALKSEKYSSWFVTEEKTYNTRRKVNKLKPTQTRTARFNKSTIPYLTNLINQV